MTPFRPRSDKTQISLGSYDSEGGNPFSLSIASPQPASPNMVNDRTRL